MRISFVMKGRLAMHIAELREGVIRDTVEEALKYCPEAGEAFEQGRMRDVLKLLSKKLESCLPSDYEEGGRAYWMSRASRLLTLIGLDKNPASPEEADQAA